MGLNSRCLWHPPLDLHTTPQALRASSSRPPLRFVEDSLWSPLGTVKNRCGDSLWFVGFGRSGVWSLRGAGSLTPKLGCRAGRWCKNAPQIRVSGRSVVKEWAQIRVSDRSVVQEWPPNECVGQVGGQRMSPDLGVGQVDDTKMTPKFDFRAVGKVKMTPKFDARGGRKGKTDPQIWCSGWSEG